MTDILKRLRHQQAASERGEPSSYVIDIWRCAADEIERLREELKAARTVPDRPIGPTAADEIELLRAERDKLRRELKRNNEQRER